uniref:Uncharacterized protein n=1 Tax=Geobacter sp. (strain M21) TaxID=443144 RepID=C6E1E1_GEOSM
MPKRGEFVGALLADAVQARVRADLEALKIAEAYSGHELLKHLPVPRFRLPDITVDFPVLVSGMGEEPQGGGSGGLFAPPKKTEVTKVVRKALLDAKIQLNYAERGKVYAAAHLQVNKLFKAGPQMLLSSQKVSGQVAAMAANAVVRVMNARGEKPENLPQMTSAVSDSLKMLLITKLTESPHLKVNVGSGEIKTHGDSESLMHVRLTISEDAYEVVSRDEGFSLVPE